MLTSGWNFAEVTNCVQEDSGDVAVTLRFRDGWIVNVAYALATDCENGNQDACRAYAQLCDACSMTGEVDTASIVGEKLLVLIANPWNPVPVWFEPPTSSVGGFQARAAAPVYLQ